MSAYLLNPWAFVQFAHNQLAAVVTGPFAVAAIGAFLRVARPSSSPGEALFARGNVRRVDRVASGCFPTGDAQAKMVGHHQPITLAAMEGKFESGPMAPVTSSVNQTLPRSDSTIRSKSPAHSAFLLTDTLEVCPWAERFSEDAWPDNIELLYYSFHIMITLGTLFIGLMGLATLQNWRGRLESSRLLLWILMLAFPYPYIANTLGWMTAELGRQPWLIYGLFHTRDGYSKVVSNGDAIFTLIGFTGLYFVLGLLFSRP